MIVRKIAHTPPLTNYGADIICIISTYIRIYTVKRCTTQYNLHCTYFIILFIIIIRCEQCHRHYTDASRAVTRGIIDMGTPYTYIM